MNDASIVSTLNSMERDGTYSSRATSRGERTPLNYATDVRPDRLIPLGTVFLIAVDAWAVKRSRNFYKHSGWEGRDRTSHMTLVNGRTGTLVPRYRLYGRPSHTPRTLKPSVTALVLARRLASATASDCLLS